ncbi:MAG TPA: rhamnulokinase family protein [Pirellulales bacterium]|nr:rhamnulokinase family protein [Pirellulales bacterium]
MAEQTYLAVDMGASGGRVSAGSFDGRRLRLDEVHRFENGAVAAAGGLYWDVLRLWSQVCQGLRSAGTRFGRSIHSVGVDTWGVDFALLGRGDVLLENPHSYRDPRCEGMLENALALVGREEIFAQTGLQFMPINTLYQFMSLRAANSPLLDAAESLLLMPDLFHWLLTGVKSNEFTNATTTQFFNPTQGRWATELLERLDLPTRLLGDVVGPGTRLGSPRREVAAETGLIDVGVVLPGTHDTASAVMAVPAKGESSQRPDWCYISSGTWSLMGVEVTRPVINDECRRLNFTNEGGVGATIRLLKNITGLWLAQECRRVWRNDGRDLTWDELNQLSGAARPLASLVDPDDAAFQSPGDMPEAIRAFCRRGGQQVPADFGAVIRCALESLALKSRWVLEGIERLTGAAIETIHIVGGGTRNRQLCQATADACQRRVVAGPIEATALGNLMVQAIAAGAVGSITEAREIIRRSFPVAEYEPRDSAPWAEAYEKFKMIAKL